MKYLHTMVRVSNLENSIDFYCNKLGLKELNRYESEEGRFTLAFLAVEGDEDAQVELTFNWDPEDYDEGRNFGHLAYAVDNIYDICQKLMDNGVLSIVLLETAAWLLFVLRITYLLSYYRLETHFPKKSRG